jgi:2-polyprenyl-3-methyl-5-hydroxy-6-metoxy-1,4-benzoquinol methylase
MRFPAREEVKDEWQLKWGWLDDQKCFFNPRRKKSSVFSYFLRFNGLMDLIHRNVPVGGRILEFGPAQCNFSLLLAEEGYKVTAVDLQQGFLDYARLKYEKGDLELVQGNFMDFSRPQEYDAVLCGEIIEHVAFPKDLMLSAAKNLKVGGILLLSTPNGAEEGSALPTFSEVEDITRFMPKQFHWGDHLFLYTREELRKLGGRVRFNDIP